MNHSLELPVVTAEGKQTSGDLDLNKMKVS